MCSPTFEDLVTVPLQVRDELHTQLVSGEHAFHLDKEVHGLAQTLVIAEPVVLLRDLRRATAHLYKTYPH